MAPLKNLTGKTFGLLTVIELIGRNKRGDILWVCECQCGKTITAIGNNLRNGHTKSCGCLRAEVSTWVNTRHAHCFEHIRTPEYRIWTNMKSRCLNPKVRAYPDYGGRGITICPEWQNDFETFYRDMGPRPSSRHSIDRIDLDGNYEPNNCRWAVDSIQNRNKRFRGNESGVRGVYRNNGNWIARISVNGKQINLGTYDSVGAAAEARKQAERRFFEESNG